MSLFPSQSQLFEKLFSTAEIASIFSDERYLANMLLFELELAKAQADLDIIPREAAEQISSSIVSFTPDIAKLSDATEKSSIPTIELLKQLREHVGGEAASFIHWGATSQDVMDTAVVLQIKDAIELLEASLNDCVFQLVNLAEKHKLSIMSGRTHSQQALVITFGFKVANWLAPLLRHKERLTELKKRVVILQFGGAVGTLASLADTGIAVQEKLAKNLGLGLALMPWHSQRDSFAELASWLSLVTGSLAKMAQDIILLVQSEIGELKESNDPSRGGSSTMPQKSNPIQSELIITAARQNAQLLASMHNALIQEHERGTHGWQLEWLALPQMFHLSASALKKALCLSQNMIVNTDVMLANVKASKGIMLAEYYSFELAKQMPRAEAKALVKQAVAKQRSSARHLADELADLTNPSTDWSSKKDEASYLGSSLSFIETIIQEAKKDLDA